MNTNIRKEISTMEKQIGKTKNAIKSNERLIGKYRQTYNETQESLEELKRGIQELENNPYNFLIKKFRDALQNACF